MVANSSSPSGIRILKARICTSTRCGLSWIPGPVSRVWRKSICCITSCMRNGSRGSPTPSATQRRKHAVPRRDGRLTTISGSCAWLMTRPCRSGSRILLKAPPVVSMAGGEPLIAGRPMAPRLPGHVQMGSVWLIWKRGPSQHSWTFPYIRLSRTGSGSLRSPGRLTTLWWPPQFMDRRLARSNRKTARSSTWPSPP